MHFVRLFAAVSALALTSTGLRAADAYEQLAVELAKGVTNDSLKIGVEGFFYQDTDRVSPFSSLLRSELKRSLAQQRKFALFARDNLSDLDEERQFQKMKEWEARVRTRGGTRGPEPEVQALVRGRFYHEPGQFEVSVHAELVLLKDESILASAKVNLPALKVAVPILPEGLAAGRKNQAEVKRLFIADRHDFDVTVRVASGKRVFRAGERISYEVTLGKDAHLAILVHQPDGSTVLLFPNAWSDNTWVPAGRKVAIPGAERPNFEFVIREPFGQDIVQIIACTKASELHQLLAKQAAGIPAAEGFRGIPRGMVAQGLKASLEDKGDALWSFETLSVESYPR